MMYDATQPIWPLIHEPPADVTTRAQIPVKHSSRRKEKKACNDSLENEQLWGRARITSLEAEVAGLEEAYKTTRDAMAAQVTEYTEVRLAAVQ